MKTEEHTVKKTLCCMLVLVLLLAPLANITVLAIGDDGETEEEALPVVTGVRVSLTEDFLVRFYFRLPEGGSAPYALIDNEIYDAEATEEEGLYVVTYTGISLSAMAENIKVVPVCRVDKKICQGIQYRFSVRDYAMRLLTGGEIDPALRRVLVTMLNFGTAAQIYNAKGIHNLANDYLSAADKVITEREYASSLAAYGTATQTIAQMRKASLVINEQVCLKIYVDVAGQEDLRINGGAGFPEWQHLSKESEAAKLVQDIWVEVADNLDFENAATFPLEKIKTMDCYRVVTTGIYANRFSGAYYIRICTPEGVSQTLQYGAETYVARNLNAASMTDEGRIMVKAMIEYGDAVLAYSKEKQAS